MYKELYYKRKENGKKTTWVLIEYDSNRIGVCFHNMTYQKVFIFFGLVVSVRKSIMVQCK